MNAKFSPYSDSYDTPDFVFDYTSAFDYSSIHHMTALKKPEKYMTIFNYNKRQVVVDLSDCEPEPWQSTVIRTIVTFFCYLFLVFTFPVTCWVCIKRVPSLERIAVFRLGKLQPVQGPGLVLVFPVIDSYMKVDLKPKVFEVPAREVLTGDGAIIEVGAELHWQVVHSVRYVTRVKEVDATVGALCQQCLASLLGCSDQDDLDRRREAIEATLLTKLNETILPWGLEVIKVTLKVARVVKTAEPSNPLTPVMSAIKSVLGFPSEHAKTQASVPPGPAKWQWPSLCIVNRVMLQEAYMLCQQAQVSHSSSSWCRYYTSWPCLLPSKMSFRVSVLRTHSRSLLTPRMASQFMFALTKVVWSWFVAATWETEGMLM
ncbi:uncharacterized protein [Dermacentor andersoni]|uniref:uncharacterized protein isoform X2 n=1 Tax=Dermacentor andersoni TaxID=34620 RepID=UPI002155C931|nr:stomatin-like protein 1 isoform X2 [Dermacentor andersoni]